MQPIVKQQYPWSIRTYNPMSVRDLGVENVYFEISLPPDAFYDQIPLQGMGAALCDDLLSL